MLVGGKVVGTPRSEWLFFYVTIKEGNYQSWKDSISPANAELLIHVRLLWISTTWQISDWNTYPINLFFNYLPSFHYLRRLCLTARASNQTSPGSSRFSQHSDTPSCL